MAWYPSHSEVRSSGWANYNKIEDIISSKAKKENNMKITVYSKPNCIQCEQTKKLLNKIEADYTVIDVTQDEEAYNYITNRLGYKAAPVIVVEDEEGLTGDSWSGFNPEKIYDLKKI